MKKLWMVFGVLLLTFSGNVFAQAPEEKPLPESGLYRNSVFIELAGNAGGLSLNYERLLPMAAPGKMLVLRAGTFLAPDRIRQDKFSYTFLLPLEASMLMGKRAVKLEIGLGVTLERYYNSSINANGEHKQYSTNEFVPIMRIGGRWQKPGKHWFVKVAFTPFLEEYYYAIKFPFSPWAGISVGYNFGKKVN